MMFILQIEAGDAGLVTWARRQRGAVVRHLQAIRLGRAAGVFHNRVGDVELRRVRKAWRRRAFIYTPTVKAEELGARRQS